MVTKYALVVLAVVGRCFGQGAPAAPEEEEYVLNFDSPVYVCPDDVSSKYIDTSKIEIKEGDGSTHLSGSFNFLQGMEQNTMLEVQIEKETSGRYEKVVSHSICDLCSELKNKDSEYKDYFKYFEFPEKCPFDAQEYNMHDFRPDTSDFPVNAQNAGNYQANVMMYKTDGDCKSGDKTLLACMKMDLIMEPVK